MQDKTVLELLTYSDLTILLIVLSIIIGLCLHLKILWNLRVATAGILAVVIGASTGFAIASDFGAITVGLICLVQFYRFFSYLRVVKNRVQKDALRLRSRRTEVFFGLVLVLALICQNYFNSYETYSILLILAFLEFTFSVIFLQKINASSHETKIPLLAKHIPDIELPSITVAIPARNETSELTDCLQELLKSNYPKMEIVVLDDCSQDSTSEIIKSFAHQGVRFLEGTIPKGSWLYKNHAYEQLFQESEGKLILFCGVDVRFEKDSIRKLVEIYVNENQKMISVLPTRNGLAGLNNIIQPMRYWRELAIPKVFSKHPACLGTCWLIERKFLGDIGGFSAFKQNIKPEKHFAKHAKTSKQFRFYVSSSGLGISSIKNYHNQWLTSLRTRYPEHKKQPENVFIFTIWFAVIFASPFAVTLISLFSGYMFPAILGLFSTILLLYVHFKVDFMTNGKTDFFKVILFPLTVVSEIVLINYSMWAYEFSEVIWKGRNICLPVLKVVPKLPNIDKT